MASLVYDKMMDALVKAGIDFSTANKYKVMLVTAAYTPDKAAHQFRNQVTNETTGTGYTSGGVVSAVTLNNDVSNHRQDVTFGTVSWTNATITARAAVIYQDNGSAATDRLIAYVDFSQDVSSTNAAFAVTFSSPLRFQN